MAAASATATHAASLRSSAPDRARAYYRLANGVQVVAGNKQVATGVAAGRFAVAITPMTLIGLKAGKPVAIVFPDRDGMGTLFLPNTVEISRAVEPCQREEVKLPFAVPDRSARRAGGFRFR